MAVHEPLRVFIVEDSPIISRLLVTATQAAGAVLLGTSDNAQDAIAQLSQVQPDLILIDIALASGSGFDVLRALQSASTASTAIKAVLTNHATDENRKESSRLGASHFFDKSTGGWLAIELINELAASRKSHGESPGADRRERK
jgi:CheY-like chemotaxis protein